MSQAQPKASPIMGEVPFLPSVAQVGAARGLGSCVCSCCIFISHLDQALPVWLYWPPVSDPANLNSTVDSSTRLPLLQVSFCLVYLWVLGLYIYSLLIKRSR